MGNIDISLLITADAKKAEAQAALQGTFEIEVQKHLDKAAKGQGYDNIMTVVSYAEEPAVARFQKDGQAFRVWRSKVWEYAYEQLAAVEAGTRSVPSQDEFLAELPALELVAA